jgi:TATA-box binding protein (TBP) (component of TFIID and TFIIIB)
MDRDFGELKVSTRTVIATVNVELDIENIFQEIPMIQKMVPPILKTDKEGDDQMVHTRIDTMYYKNRTRTWTSRGIYQNEESTKSFRNALNVIMLLGGSKKINFKVSKNGKFQITGCKSLDHARIATFSFLNILTEYCPNYLRISSNDSLIRIFFQIVMTNVDCGTGFCINRQSLDKIINKQTPYHSLLETSFGYTGVNIKFPVQTNWYELKVPILEWEINRPTTLQMYDRPLKELVEEPSNKKPKYNTFLVFHSGQFIMSGMHEGTMRDDYNRFMGILKNYQPHIRENLETF